MSIAGARVFGAGCKRARVHQEREFTVQLVDGAGNDVDGEADVGLAFKGPAGVEAGVDDLGDGSYTVNYVATEKGVYEIDVTVDDVDVEGSPFVVHVYDPDDPYARVSGKGCETGLVGEPNICTLQVLDSEGAPLEDDSDIGLEISGPSGAEAALEDLENGTFELTFSVDDPGDYLIRCVADDEALCEFSVTIVEAGQEEAVDEVAAQPEEEADTTDGAQCTAEGDGLQNALVDTTVSFVITMRDGNGQEVGHGGQQVEVKINGEGQGAVVDNGDGTFDAVYQVDSVGEHTIDVFVNDAHIAGSPFAVSAASSAVAAHCTLSGATEQAYTSTANSIVLQLADHNGAPLSAHDPCDTVSAFFGGENRDHVSGNLVDNGDGTFEFVYEATVPGTYELTVSVNDELVSGSPCHILVNPRIDASQSFAVGDGLGRCETETPATFVVETVDENGAQVTTGGAPVAVRIDGKDRDTAMGAVIDNNDGSYEVVWQAHNEGHYQIHVSVGDEPIRGSPFVVYVSPRIDASLCKADCAEGLNIAMDSVTTVCVTTYTHSGIRATQGGQNVSAYMSAAKTGGSTASISGAVVDNDDGTYDIIFENNEDVGHYLMHILVDGQPIEKSPFKVAVGDTAASPEETRVAGLNKRATVGEHSVACVVVRTADGNYKKTGGDTVRAQLDVPSGGGNAGECECSVEDNEDGSYDVIYMSRETGRHFLSIELNGAVIDGSPFSIEVGRAGAGEGAASAPKTVYVVQTGGAIDEVYHKAGGGARVGSEPASKRVLGHVAPLPFKVSYASACLKEERDEWSDNELATLAGMVLSRDSGEHILVTHGATHMIATAKHLDTLHEEKSSEKVVVLTGAFTPESAQSSDASVNIGMALGALNVLPPGVFIAMNGLVIPAHEVTRREDGLFAFE